MLVGYSRLSAAGWMRAVRVRSAAARPWPRRTPGWESRRWSTSGRMRCAHSTAFVSVLHALVASLWNADRAAAGVEWLDRPTTQYEGLKNILKHTTYSTLPPTSPFSTCYQLPQTLRQTQTECSPFLFIPRGPLARRGGRQRPAFLVLGEVHFQALRRGCARAADRAARRQPVADGPAPA